MAACNCTRPHSVAWIELLGRFSDGLSLLAVTRRSLVEQDIADDEQASLLTGIAALSAVYDELDAALNRKAVP